SPRSAPQSSGSRCSWGGERRSPPPPAGGAWIFNVETEGRAVLTAEEVGVASAASWHDSGEQRGSDRGGKGRMARGRCDMARCTQVGDGPRGRRDHEPSSAKRYALFLVGMAFMLSLLGQDCTISCNPPPSQSCAGCTGDQVVVLDRFCATPRKAGESC